MTYEDIQDSYNTLKQTLEQVTVLDIVNSFIGKPVLDPTDFNNDYVMCFNEVETLLQGKTRPYLTIGISEDEHINEFSGRIVLPL